MATLETQSQFAQRIGKHKAWVTRQKQQGRLVMQGGLVDVEASLQRLEATESPMPHHQANAARMAQERAERAQQPAEQPSTQAGAAPDIEKVGAALKFETYKLQKAKAQKAAMELEQMAGSLVVKEDVERALTDLGAVIRQRIENLPARLAPQLSACGGDMDKLHAELSIASNELLHDLADTLDRRSRDLDHTQGDSAA